MSEAEDEQPITQRELENAYREVRRLRAVIERIASSTDPHFDPYHFAQEALDEADEHTA